MKRLLQACVCLLALMLVSSVGAHWTEIEQVTLVELADNHYAIRYAAPPPGMSEFDAPLLPPDCHWLDDEDNLLEETATSLVFAKAEGRPLTAEDRIVLPWQRNGVLVVAKWRDGSTARQFFMSGAEGIVVEMAMLRAGSGSVGATARRYTLLGLEHILGGIDHLLFVAGLLLLVRGTRRLLLTITAFTLAHSLTLALSVLGWVSLPQPPVEAVIALSILLLAVENVHLRRGSAGLAARRPWAVSFLFGLVHGLGFAGALGQLGLPPAEVPSALLFFNVGVEVGQLLFVAVWLCLAWLVRRISKERPSSPLALVPHYLLGTVSAFWFLERTVSMFMEQ